ncbi:hypothetical protein EDB89DRAFT_2068149 [Lactarius sanguifluus]|nr:hypothetical protein EDB89DRAFT_2068149 [Lactarius sanguifluus]
MPLILGTLQENVRAIPAVLDWVGASHAASPIVHIHPHSMATLSASASASAKPPNTDIVDEALAQGVWIVWARRLRAQELVEATSEHPARCHSGAVA